MKKIFQSNFWTLLIGLFLTNFSLAQDATSQNDREVIQWLRQNNVPIEHMEAENGFSDLLPLKEVFKDVKVVGLGENTHGTREFFQLKHRLLEFLVTEMGFQAFAIEASYANCLPINDYVLYGKGNREAVLTGQGYTVWDTREVAKMIDWMRTYNKNVPDSKKVRFYGIDYGYNDLGAQKISGYLQKKNLKDIAATDSLLQTIATLGKENWPRTMANVQNELKQALPGILRLIDFLTQNKEKFAVNSDTKEFDEVVVHAYTMKQFLLNNIIDSLPESAHLNMVRSRSMATNLFRILNIESSLGKVVVWAHNSHVSVGHPETSEPNMGYELKKKFGAGYYAVGFEFNKGAYQSRNFSSDTSGNLEAIEVSSAPKGYVSWYLSQAVNGNGWLDLRYSKTDGFVRHWLKAPQIFRSFSWRNDPVSLQKTIPAIIYDGILFVEHTKPTVPNPNAVRTVSRGERF